jgi:hypothetical protein
VANGLIYQDWKFEIKTCLEDLRCDGVQLAKDVIGQTLLDSDFYIISIIDKCIRLIDGFTVMLEKRNLTCMGIILRVQIDNCLRTYAPFVAKNQSEVFKSIYDETQINKMIAKDGKRMSDAYLRKRLSEIDSRFDSVYKEASGYIHHSEKAFYTMATAEEPYILTFNLGNPISEKLDPVLKECVDAFIHFVKIQYRLTIPFIESKKTIDS